MNICLVTLGLALPVLAAMSAAPADGLERGGLCPISDKPFPAPAGTEPLALPGGDFEITGHNPPGWEISGGSIVAAPDTPGGVGGPRGKAYCRIGADKGNAVRAPEVKARGGRPYFVSFRLRNPSDNWAAVTFGSDEKFRTFAAIYPAIPSTGDQWKRVGLYFWMPAQCNSIRFHVSPRQERPKDQFIGIDDIQLRTATVAEMGAAYAAEHKLLPPYDTAPRPGDGQNLALSVAKWEGRAGIPGKPFVIWAIGSSWTAAMDNGYGLMQTIREHFPKAPELLYRRHDGAGTPWQFDYGWVKQFVAADQPDLIFTYTPGTLEGLDALLTEIRRRTTADIIVPSIHFGVKDTDITPELIEKGFVDWEKAREICRKHHAEFVEHRRDIADYLKHTGLTPDDLLWDHVHQNQHGRIRVWDSIARHITNPGEFTYAPEAVERRIPVAPPAATATEQVTLAGDWTTRGGAIHTAQAGARIKVRFTGNRIDLLGRAAPGGGTVEVLVDGRPGGEAPVFYTTYIQPEPKVYPRPDVGGQPGDAAPHAVTLGAGTSQVNIMLTATTVTFDSTVDSNLTGVGSDAGSTLAIASEGGYSYNGNVIFDAAVGGTEPLGSLSVAGATTFANSVSDFV
ncbi:MAG: hypothetical protein M1457_08755, partial [bacterium]|nr:hypothetical protein [bacterium]